ncbi:MAG: DUF1080 domain-containing protein [Planctomycetia bacterium]|nr:DUF1080 domain-containing protein [Planctomycetia bacterium]
MCGTLLAGAACSSPAADEKNPAYTNEKDAGPDFAVQGEYAGKLKSDGKEQDYGAQVIAHGDGKFRLELFKGGLPGAGWKRGGDQVRIDGQTKDGATTFTGTKISAKIAGDAMSVADSGGAALGTLKKTVRKSPTLGMKPPEGAIVLFDGSSADKFDGGRMTDDKLLMVGCKTKQEFKDYTLHLEFRTPFMPKSFEQQRGNSGMYLNHRYEVQILDSFGLKGASNECGGLYSVAEPIVNMCLPPLSWQTYDVEFTAAVYDNAGKKTKAARATVKHNGVVIADNLELKHTPGGAPNEEPGIGPIFLQNHGNPVHFRNIWIVEKK